MEQVLPTKPILSHPTSVPYLLVSSELQVAEPYLVPLNPMCVNIIDYSSIEPHALRLVYDFSKKTLLLKYKVQFAFLFSAFTFFGKENITNTTNATVVGILVQKIKIALQKILCILF